MFRTRFCYGPISRRSLRKLYIGFAGLIALIFIRSFIVFSISSNPHKFRPVTQSLTNSNHAHVKIESGNPAPASILIMQIQNSSRVVRLPEQVNWKTNNEIKMTVDEVWKDEDKSILVSLSNEKPDGDQRTVTEVLQGSLHRENNDGDGKMSHYEETQLETSQISSPTIEALARDHASERPIENMDTEVKIDRRADLILSEAKAMQFLKTSSADANKFVPQSDQLTNLREEKYAPKCNADQSRSSRPDTEEDLDSVELLKISRLHKARNRKERLKMNWEKIRILQTNYGTKQFSHRLKDFFESCRCSARFFMTWFSPVSAFGPRERICIESIFKFHPLACVVIVSRSLDTQLGDCILKPFIDAGYHVMAAAPNLSSLFENTSAEIWFRRLKEGKVDPGGISLSQNLSNLLRLVLLYKFGGIYVDTDVIALRDFSNLSNSIGAQSTHASGQWNRLNNAVLIFDKSHPILLQLIRNFTTQFDGSKWGHNGPYLVSRVVEKIKRKNSSFSLTVLPPKAFYPATWLHIRRWFHSPMNEMERQWKAAKLQEVQLESYGVHLWNKQTKRLVVERDSVLADLFQRCCVFCDD